MALGMVSTASLAASGAGTRVAALDDIPIGGSLRVTVHGAPLLLIRPAERTVRAFLALCTHEGCIVTWAAEAEAIQCPCHGGEYNSDGEVTAGPPPGPLLEFPTELKEGDVYVAGP